MHYQNNSNKKHAIAEDEIDVLIVGRALKNAYKAILIGGALGILIAGLYCLAAPKRYEAFVNLEVVSQEKLGENVSIFLDRMRSSLMLNDVIIAACELNKNNYLANNPSRIISLVGPLGPSETFLSIHIKVNQISPESARYCAKIVLEMVATSQNLLIKKRAQVLRHLAQSRIVLISEEISRSKMFAARTKNMKEIALTLIDIKRLGEERLALQTSIIVDELNSIPRQTDIYVNEKPPYPSKGACIFLGLLGGIFFGIAISIVRKFWRKF